MFTVISDRNVIRAYALIWVVAYLVTYFFLKDYLPDEYFRDSITIQNLGLQGDVSDWGGAYIIAAYVAHVVPLAALSAAIAVMGSLVIWMIATSARTPVGMLIIVPVLGPFIILNIMQFGKESFVIPMTWLILWVVSRMRSPFRAFLFIAATYLVYGCFFRDYYLIILAAFAGCILFQRSSAPLRIVYVLAALCAIFCVPSQVFMDLQGSRDEINYVANLLFPMVHTAILNPVPPNSPIHFIINYLYVCARILFSFLFRQSMNEVILFANVVIYGVLIRAGLKNFRWKPLGLLPLLFIAHLLVLFIFEPDLGSYLRHASSVILYLLPGLRRIEQDRVDRAGARQSQKIVDKPIGPPSPA